MRGNDDHLPVDTAFPLGRRTERAPEDRLVPPGYFVPLHNNEAVCAHCHDNVFQHRDRIVIAGIERTMCPSAPVDMRHAPDAPPDGPRAAPYGPLPEVEP